MSIIAEYKALEAQIAEQTARLEALKNDQKLQKEIEFETNSAPCSPSTTTPCGT